MPTLWGTPCECQIRSRPRSRFKLSRFSTRAFPPQLPALDRGLGHTDATAQNPRPSISPLPPSGAPLHIGFRTSPHRRRTLASARSVVQSRAEGFPIPSRTAAHRTSSPVCSPGRLVRNRSQFLFRVVAEIPDYHPDPQSSQHALPRSPSWPSMAMIGTITNPATRSAHHHPV